MPSVEQDGPQGEEVHPSGLPVEKVRAKQDAGGAGGAHIPETEVSKQVEDRSAKESQHMTGRAHHQRKGRQAPRCVGN